MVRSQTYLGAMDSFFERLLVVPSNRASTSCSKQSSCTDLATSASLLIWKKNQDIIPTKKPYIPRNMHYTRSSKKNSGPIGPELGVPPRDTNYAQSPDRLDISKMSRTEF